MTVSELVIKISNPFTRSDIIHYFSSTFNFFPLGNLKIFDKQQVSKIWNFKILFRLAGVWEMSHWSLRGLREINCPRLILIRNGIRHKSTGERYLDVPQQPTKVNNKVLFIYYLPGHFNYSTLKELILNGTGTPYQSEIFPLGPWYNKFLFINFIAFKSGQYWPVSPKWSVRPQKLRAKSLAKIHFYSDFGRPESWW